MSRLVAKTKCVLQSMTNVPAKDVERSVAQINELAANGCELVRTAVLDEEDARAIPSNQSPYQHSSNRRYTL